MMKSVAGIYHPGQTDRVVPIHPLLIALGLLDCLLCLINADQERLFPEWKEFAGGDGTTLWSQPITKSWHYVKKVLKIFAGRSHSVHDTPFDGRSA